MTKSRWKYSDNGKTFYPFFICVVLTLIGCSDSTLSINDNIVDTDTTSITKQDTIILPHYGTIDLIIPKRDASIVNVEGNTEHSFVCRVDLTKESPITSGGGISDNWIAIDYRDDYPKWEKGMEYYNNGQIFHYSDTKASYYNDDWLNGGVANGGYDGLRKSYLHYDWPIDKTKHHGKVLIDIPGFVSSTYYADISFQGQSSLTRYPKKNFRITFYTDDSYKKKEKVKIGDLVKLSGYNIKAFYKDSSRLVEPIINAIIHKAYQTWDYQERYPWNISNPPFSGATGTIKCFPVKVTVNGEFYGVEFFGEKKDEKIYMLEGNDASGMLVQGVGYQQNFWDMYTPTRFEDQMIDEDDKKTPWVEGGTTTQSNVEALSAFYDYFNNHLERQTADIHFNKKTWIDYFIFLQVFFMFDNMCNNIILYSDSGKTQFTPFFYDLDSSLTDDFTFADVFSVAGEYWVSDKNYKGIWLKLKDLWWDDIVLRYKYLREEVLTMNEITKVAYDIKNGISTNDFENEIVMWNNTSNTSLNKILKNIEKRLFFCDSYFTEKNY